MWAHGYLFYILGYNLIVFYSLIVLVLTIRRQLLALSDITQSVCLYMWYRYVYVCRYIPSISLPSATTDALDTSCIFTIPALYLAVVLGVIIHFIGKLETSAY